MAMVLLLWLVALLACDCFVPSRRCHTRTYTKTVTPTMDIYGPFSKPVEINLGLLGWAGGQAYVNGELKVSFSPWLPPGTSDCVSCRLPLPLGMTIEQSDEVGALCFSMYKTFSPSFIPLYPSFPNTCMCHTLYIHPNRMECVASSKSVTRAVPSAKCALEILFVL